MPTRRLASVLGLLAFLVANVSAETLTFVAQFDPDLGSTNYSWFSPANWWVGPSTALVPAGRVPQANETAIVTGEADAAMSGIRVFSLVLTNGAALKNGTFAAEWLELRSDSSFSDARVNVLTFLRVGGTNCSLRATTLNILAIASGAFSPLAPAASASLNLDRGSVLVIAGSLSLAEGSLVNTLGPPQSRLVIANNALLSAAGRTTVRGAASNHLVLDNSGLVRVDNGKLTFEDGIDWQSSAFFGEFRAAGADAELLFASPMQVPVNVTDIFTGPGTNRFVGGATIDGFAQVGIDDASYQNFAPGNLVINESVNGSGALHVVASSFQAATLTWNNGTLSLPEVAIQNRAKMLISGLPGMLRRLSDCELYNSGICTLQTADLSLVQGGSINNLADGIFEVEADGAFSGGPLAGGGAFNNAGQFLKTSPGTTTFGTSSSAAGPDFNNTGIVDVRAGALHLLSGTSSGEFQTAAGGSLWFWGGTHALTSGAGFSGAGPVRLLQGPTTASWLVKSLITVDQLELGTNGTIIGQGRTSAAVVYLNKLLVTDNGTVTNANIQAQTAQLLDTPQFVDSSISISGAADVQGTNCQWIASILNISPQAKLAVQPNQPGRIAYMGLARGSVLNNAGSLHLNQGIVTGSGSPESTLILQPGALLSSTNSAVLRGSAGEPLAVDSQGTFRALGGTLAFEGGIDWLGNGGSSVFDAASATSLILFASSFRIPNTLTCLFTGPGTNRLTATCIVDGVLQSGMLGQGIPLAGNLELCADVGGSGMLHVLQNTAETGGCFWRGGKLSLASINIDSGGSLTVAGEAPLIRELSGCTINNSGLFYWPGQLLRGGGGAALNNFPGGKMEINGDALLAVGNAGPRLVLNNSGTLLKSSGAGTSSISANFTNSGLLEIRTGQLKVDGAAAQISGTTLLGEAGGFGAPSFVVQGGVVTGTGLISADTINSGSFAPGTPVGSLSISAQKNYQQGPTGSLVIEINDTNRSDRLLVGGNAQLSGELNIQFLGGFVPEPGQVFTVLESATSSGTFSRITAPAEPGTVWVARYSPTNMSVALANELVVGAPRISGGIFSFSFSTTPGLKYLVESCEELYEANWQPVTTIDGDGSVQSFTEASNRPKRFYRVVLK